MRRSKPPWWWVFLFCAAAVAGAFSWVTIELLASERKENEAREIGVALWTMDSWLGSLLIQESGRPYYEYAAYYPQRAAYTKLLCEIGEGEVVTPSPLLESRSEFVRIHFEWRPESGFSSPQVPTGNLLDLASSTVLSEAEIEANRRGLAEVEAAFRPEEARPRIESVERRLARLLTPVPCGDPASAEPPPDRQQREYASRANATRQQQKTETWVAPVGGATVEAGPLVPLWLGEPARLFFVRRVTMGEVERMQGFLVEWDRLRAALLEQIAATIPNATLVAAADDAERRARTGRLMSNLPVVIETNGPIASALPWITPIRATVALGWVAVLVAAVAAALTLRSSMAFGERRDRFASAVTHELRTPLTTFRMYSEMLADGMVPDEKTRGEYHATLKRESLRLSRLVENVLAYARLEEGRHESRRETLRLGALLERVAPALRDRAADAGLAVRVDSNGAADREITVDPDAVGQILFNLVDNACKYATPSDPKTLDVTVERSDGEVRLAVRDHGPGVPREHAARVFEPFHRGPIAPGDGPRPGVGLGLALARGLARDLGGDLTLDIPDTGGARFTLRLPE